jgi:hypothetical protein
MRKRISFAVAVLATALASPALARGYTYQTRGLGGQAYIYQSEYNDCGYTYADFSVYGSEYADHYSGEKPTGTSWGSVWWNTGSYNWCDYSYSSTSGWASGEFAVSGKPSEGFSTVSVSGSAYGYQCSYSNDTGYQDCGDATAVVDVSINGDPGTTSFGQQTGGNTGPGGIYRFRNVGTYTYGATLTGSISINGGPNLVTGNEDYTYTYTYGSTWNSKSGWVDVYNF